MAERCQPPASSGPPGLQCLLRSIRRKVTGFPPGPGPPSLVHRHELPGMSSDSLFLGMQLAGLFVRAVPSAAQVKTGPPGAQQG